MAPIRTYTNWNKRPTDVEEKVEPYRKYFFICEGKNTEVWYFKKLIDIRKSLGIHPLIDIRLMEKTGEDDSISNPKALIEFAEKQKKITENDFDSKHDKMIIVFDADIYKTKSEVYKSILELAGDENILAVSAMLHPVGQKIFAIIQQWNNFVGFNAGTYYHARKLEDNQCAFLDQEMMKAPQNISSHGRYNVIGKSCYYIAETKEGAVAEILKHSGGRKPRIKVLGLRPGKNVIITHHALSRFNGTEQAGYHL